MVGILNTLISNNGYYYVLSQINFTRLKSRGFNNAISHEHKKQLENIAELTKDHELAQFLILHNAAISFSESFMAQLFQRALNNEDITFINYLINERKVDPQGRYACTDNETVITYMLKNKIVPEDTKKDIFELFLTQFGGQCLEADGSTALNVVCEQQNNQLLETIIQRQPLDTQTAFSAFQHLLKNPISNSTRVEQCISLLLEKNHDFCNVNDQSTNRIPLHDVSRSAQLPVECLEQLLLYTTNLDAQDSQGNTSLTEAVKSGNVEKVDLLVSRGANVNTQNHAGETPLGLSLKNYQSYPHYQSYPLINRIHNA